MPRLVSCNFCHILQRIPDVSAKMPLVPARLEWKDGQDYIFKEDDGHPKMVPAFDPVLEDFVERHTHGLDDSQVIGGLIQVYAVDQNTWDTMDIVTKIQEQLQKQNNEWYEERDEYKDSAVRCYNAHGNPDLDSGCPDYMNDDRRIGHAEYKDEDGRVITVPPQFRQYLCYLCPFQQTYIQTEIRRKRGGVSLMASINALYEVASDSWTLSYDPSDTPFPTVTGDTLLYTDGDLPPSGSWSVLVSPFDVGDNAGIGLVFLLDDDTELNFLAHRTFVGGTTTWMAPYTSGQITLRGDWDGADLSLYYSNNGEQTWHFVGGYTPAAGVGIHDVGLILRYDDESQPALARATAARLLPGLFDNGEQDTSLSSPPPMVSLFSVPPPHTADEPMVHIVIGAPFGDLENDIGKSVRWIDWFCDNMFVLDINTGDPRYWIVNWAETFPDAAHAVTGTNYFVKPAQFRQEQWAGFQRAWGAPDDTSWVLFLDGTEGFSVDNRSLPNDYAFAPFQSFIWREIQRANGLGQTSVVLPHFAFLRSSAIVNVSYEDPATADPSVPGVLQAVSTPYYFPYQGLRRLWRCDQLKNPAFDWSQLDAWVTPDPAVKAQIISYSYAHWNMQDIVPPATKVEPLDADNDDGWRMRNLISKIRPIPSLPYGTTWQPPSADPAGVAGPWPIAIALNTNPTLKLWDEHGVLLTPPTPNAAAAAITTPLYDTIFRLNMRDGVWYEEGVSGNIPLKWNADAQVWVTDYNPALWPDKGVKAKVP